MRCIRSGLLLLGVILLTGCASAGVQQWTKVVDRHIDFEQPDPANVLRPETYGASIEYESGHRGWGERDGWLWLSPGENYPVAQWFSNPNVDGVYLGRVNEGGEKWDVFLLVVSRPLIIEEGNYELMTTQLAARRSGPDPIWRYGEATMPHSRVLSEGIAKLTEETKYEMTPSNGKVTVEGGGQTWWVELHKS